MGHFIMEKEIKTEKALKVLDTLKGLTHREIEDILYEAGKLLKDSTYN